MRQRTIGEINSNEIVQKKFISPKAVFVYLLCAAAYLIQRTSFRILATAAPGDRLDP
jgi:hypothetical protein